MSADLYGCEKCRTRERDALEQVGEPAEERSFYKSSETRTNYRCRVCGAKWSYVVESGLSKGKFWNKGWGDTP